MNSLPFSTSVELLVQVSRRRPSLMPTDRSLLAEGDSCCCYCFRAPREVCLNGVVSPPICALRCCPLMLPKHRQSKMASGDFVMPRDPSRPRFEKQNITPYLCPRYCLQPPFPLPPKLVVAPVDCVPRADVSPSYHRAALRVRR